jgi:hypothetical protein
MMAAQGIGGCAEDEGIPSSDAAAGSSGSSTDGAGQASSAAAGSGEQNGGGAAGSGGDPGGTAGRAAGSAGAQGGEGPVNPFPCNDPEPAVGGYETCNPDGTPEERYYRKPSKGVCPSSVPREGSIGAGGAGGTSGDECTTDADCTGANEFCTPHDWCAEYGTPGYSCMPGCTSDEDCGDYADKHICVCGELLDPSAPIGLCVRASCETDSDCAPGFFCTLGHGAFGRPEVACQTREDECAGSWCDYQDNGDCAFHDVDRNGDATSPHRMCDLMLSCGGP